MKLITKLFAFFLKMKKIKKKSFEQMDFIVSYSGTAIKELNKTGKEMIFSSSPKYTQIDV